MESRKSKVIHPKLKAVICFWLLPVICCLVSLFSFSQDNRKIDSLVSVLKQAKEDTTALNVYEKLLNEYNIKNTNYAIVQESANNALQLADKLLNESKS